MYKALFVVAFLLACALSHFAQSLGLHASALH